MKEEIMGFVKFERRQRHVGVAAGQPRLTVTNRTLVLSKSAMPFLDGIERVDIFFDETKRLIAIKSSEDFGAKVTRKKGCSQIGAVGFLAFAGIVLKGCKSMPLPCWKEGDMVIAGPVPEEYMKQEGGPP